MIDDELESLKSVTVLRMPLPGNNENTTQQRQRTCVPFRVVPLDSGLHTALVHCPTTDESVIALITEQGPARVVQLPADLADCEIMALDTADGNGGIFLCTSSNAQGSSLKRCTVDSRMFLMTNVELICGGTRSKGFVDGAADVAEVNLLTHCAYFCDPKGLEVVAVADKGNFAIRLVNVSRRDRDGFGAVRTICGCGVPGYADGNSSASMLREVCGLQWTADGSLLFTDGPNHAVRILKREQPSDRVLSAASSVGFHGTVFTCSTIIGGTARRQGLQDGPTHTALCNFPCGIASGPVPQSFLIADTGNNAVRLVDTTVNSVRTLVSTEDYGDNSPLPQGLVDVSQVFALVLKDDPLLTQEPLAVALMTLSQSTRSVSVIVTSSLPLPPRRSSAALSVGSLYGVARSKPDVSCVSHRCVMLTKAPKSCGPQLPGQRPPKTSTSYAAIEESRHKRQQDATTRSVSLRDPSPPMPSASTAPQPPRAARVATNHADPKAESIPAGREAHQAAAAETNEAQTAEVRNLQVIYDALSYGVAAADDNNAAAPTTSSVHQSMRPLSFWSFCVVAALTYTSRKTSPAEASCYDYVFELYCKSFIRAGYKVLARMPFPAFCRSILQLRAHLRTLDCSTPSQRKGGEHLARLDLADTVKAYCLNSQDVCWKQRLTLLDLICVNEAPIQKIFDAYANTIDRRVHVGRVPYVRFQSVFHAVRVYPGLVTQANLKQAFNRAVGPQLFSCLKSDGMPHRVDSDSTELQPPLDTAWKDQSMNLYQFVEGIIHVAWLCFGQRSLDANESQRSDRFLTSLCVQPHVEGDAVVVAVETLFRWMNVEIESMMPATEVAERNRQGNNEACAVFPPKIPLFECRQQQTSSNNDKLQKDLRKLRRVQDAVDAQKV